MSRSPPASVIVELSAVPRPGHRLASACLHSWSLLPLRRCWHGQGQRAGAILCQRAGGAAVADEAGIGRRCACICVGEPRCARYGYCTGQTIGGLTAEAVHVQAPAGKCDCTGRVAKHFGVVAHCQRAAINGRRARVGVRAGEKHRAGPVLHDRTGPAQDAGVADAIGIVAQIAAAHRQDADIGQCKVASAGEPAYVEIVDACPER